MLKFSLSAKEIIILSYFSTYSKHYQMQGLIFFHFFQAFLRIGAHRMIEQLQEQTSLSKEEAMVYLNIE